MHTKYKTKLRTSDHTIVQRNLTSNNQAMQKWFPQNYVQYCKSYIWINVSIQLCSHQCMALLNYTSRAS